MGVLVHGDAAFAGQGLVTEVLQLHNLAGYRTGGTVHVIVNNQVGFTASPQETRSTPYATDVAQMIQCPIWHVNGDDLDAVADVCRMAMEYRAAFASDVVIDIYCYRKYGHNEGDEPSFTQPLMYERIQQRPSVLETYGQRLVADGVVEATTIGELTAARASALEGELAAARSTTRRPRNAALGGLWRGYLGGPAAGVPDVETGVALESLHAIAERMVRLPEGFTAHPKVLRLLEQRAQMGRGERPIDWGMGEMLAYASLLVERHNVRLTGQDCGRGTFSHRHAILTDIKNGYEHLVLGGLDAEQGLARVYDSPLSEAGVLGFEYGFSLDFPDALVLWEAQFGDFANGAQVIIDQFITAGEDKWNRLSGLVMLLPHGFEGQGPEHSSARLERFLQQCAEDNIQVAQPSTPAQMFHLLRRQVKRPWRKPLIVMTPKSLLRSTLAELTTGTFQRVLPDPEIAGPAAKRVLLCTGKIYYELVEARRKRNDTTTAIVRLEQLYPLRPEHVQAALVGVAADADVAWVQDEPGNMGAATFIVPRLTAILGRSVRSVSRDVDHRSRCRSLVEERRRRGRGRRARRRSRDRQGHGATAVAGGGDAGRPGRRGRRDGEGRAGGRRREPGRRGREGAGGCGSCGWRLRWLRRPRPAAAAAAPAVASPAVAAALPASITAAPAAAAALDEDALLRLSPSQRRLARERGELPADAPVAAAAPAAVAAPAAPVRPRRPRWCARATRWWRCRRCASAPPSGWCRRSTSRRRSRPSTRST
jgi:2-oxoglutarate dehydrogenase E1 component